MEPEGFRTLYPPPSKIYELSNQQRRTFEREQVSNLVSGLVYNRAPYEDARFNVLLALADSANDDGYAYNSLIEIARKSRVSYRGTVYSIQKLESGLINSEKVLRVIRHKKKGMSNDYYINVPLLETLPKFWPSGLLSRAVSWVQPVHPKATAAPVEKPSLLGATVENLGCNRDENRVQSVHPSHDLFSHDLSSPIHDRLTDPVENFSGGAAQGGLFDPSSLGDLVRFQTGSTALPRGGRHLRNESDPGGWSGAEVSRALMQILGRELHDGDRRALATLAELKFSTELTIYLLWQVKRKSDAAVYKAKTSKSQPPVLAAYFSTALQKLWSDCELAIRKAEGETMRMTPIALFWYHNAVVMKEISFWENNLGRS